MTEDNAGAPEQAAVPAYTLFLDQSAHLDWDWIQTFEQNYQAYSQSWYSAGGVKQILDQAIAKLAQPAYYYTICEMGFLRRYITDHPDAVATLQAFGDRFQILSGGITSPDCQVCAGESFIRNYLVGQVWANTALEIAPRAHCWLPDDFGQGPELPALLAALGFISVAFSRLPGTQPYYTGPAPLKTQLLNEGLDFSWTASDGSTVAAHWLSGGYAAGITLETQDLDTAVKGFIDDYSGNSPLSAAGAPVLYVPIDNDFQLPIPGDFGSPQLLDLIATWNSGSGPQETGVTLCAGTYHQFMTARLQNAPLLPFAGTGTYDGTPYWTGYYASRPALKTLHYACLRTLLAAEVFGLVAGRVGAALPNEFWNGIAEAWMNFTPSTHHDYVCGTANDYVYQNEQLPLLTQTNTAAQQLHDAALSATAALAPAGADAMLGNALGFARSGIVRIPAAPPAGALSLASNGMVSAIQPTGDGSTLAVGSVPSLGCASASFSSEAPSPTQPVAQIHQDASGAFVLTNDLLRAAIDESGELLSLMDLATGENILRATGSGPGLAFYIDDGGLYRFGNEPKNQSEGGRFTLDGTVALTPVSATVLESGPLRVTMECKVQTSVGGQSYDYVREYALVAGEPILRVRVTGAAPSGYSVLASLALQSDIVTLDHGTPGHWTSRQPSSEYWSGPVFRATHDFVLARDGSGNCTAAIYHGGVPAWAIDGGRLIGCLLRNTPADDGLGAAGSDSEVHVQDFAIRVPGGLQPPETGAPLREALAFAVPLAAVIVPAAAAGAAASVSLAATPADCPALVTVAKPGSYDPGALILRLQQPTNAPLSVPLILPGVTPASAELATASEQPWKGGGAVTVNPDGSMTIAMTGAIATLAIGLESG